MTATTNPRDVRPAIAPPGPFIPPPPAAFEMAAGARGLIHERHELPLVRVQLLLQGGGAADPVDQAGLGDLAATLLKEGAGDCDAVAFAEALDALGASFSVGASADATALHLAVLKKHLKPAMNLLLDALLRPRFDAAAFARVKAQTIGALRQRNEQPQAAASLAAVRTLFGEGHPLGRAVDGSPESVERLALADVKARWAAAAAAPLSVLATGDVAPDELRALLDPALEARARSASGAPPRVGSTPAQRGPTLRTTFVDRPGAPQSVIFFAWPGPGYADPERLAFASAVSVFGGSFTSRLNANLREKHGFTYGARARGDYYRGAEKPAEGPGLVTASAAVNAEHTGAAVREFLREFDRMRAGDIVADEVEKARAGIRNGRVYGCETLEGQMGELTLISTFDLPLDRSARDLARLEALTVADVNAAARRLLPPDGGVLVVAGARAAAEPQLRALDLPLVF
ncbi:MAG TPA: pitrilysin family protein [Planctomycetota bacterium]|nr:pitrilysin family protein [Planctomycetota bacterium]